MRAFHKGAITSTAALAYCLLLTGATHGEKIKKTVPLFASTWTADLRQYGYEDTDLGFRLQEIRRDSYFTDTAFLKEQELVETFVTREVVAGLQRREDTHRALPYKLHALVIDAASGRLLRHLEWPSDYAEIGLVPHEDGSFAVFLGDRLEFYSADFVPGRRLKLTDRNTEEIDMDRFSSSPSGKTMLIRYGETIPNICVVVVDEAIVAVIEKCDLPNGTVTSDEELAGYIGNRERTVGGVSIRKFQGPWLGLVDDSNFSRPEFVTENALLVWNGEGPALIRSDGAFVFAEEGGATREGAFVHSYVEKLSLIAVPLFGRVEDPNHPSVRRLEAMVIYDVANGPPVPRNWGCKPLPPPEEIFRVKNERKIHIQHLLGLAISPGGERFAVEGDGILRCFKMPTLSKFRLDNPKLEFRCR